MAGSQGSTWNINPLATANQPDNRPLAQWLSGFVRNLLPGDFNRDGVVDAADYVVWRKTEGQSVTYFASADGDGSGLINADDLSIWLANYGNSSGGGAGFAAGIPEPATLWLLLAAATVHARSRGTRRCRFAV
jgi:hypothetical protein